MSRLLWLVLVGHPADIFHSTATGMLVGSIAGKAWKGMLDVEGLAEVLVQKA